MRVVFGQLWRMVQRHGQDKISRAEVTKWLWFGRDTAHTGEKETKEVARVWPCEKGGGGEC